MPTLAIAFAITYVVIGDSTAAGVGAPYDSGIAAGTTAALSLTHRVTMTNLGVSGARMKDVARDQLAKAAALKPDVVLLAASANDVTHLTPVRSLRRDLETIVRALKAANPPVKIVLTGSPDKGSPPRVPFLLRGIAAWQAARYNRMMDEVARREGLVRAPIAEVTGPMFRKDRTLFDSDRFHPNARGYATWTAVLNEAIARALGGS
jgi:lysophospholipase L1-like esterase